MICPLLTETLLSTCLVEDRRNCAAHPELCIAVLRVYAYLNVDEENADMGVEISSSKSRFRLRFRISIMSLWTENR